eukprot:scaffold1913_cov257-Pinguiococcus_pyrenoidosus.AAC.3
MPLTAVLRFKVRNPDGLFSWEPRYVWRSGRFPPQSRASLSGSCYRRFTLLPPEPKSERLMQVIAIFGVTSGSLSGVFEGFSPLSLPRDMTTDFPDDPSARLFVPLDSPEPSPPER